MSDTSATLRRKLDSADELQSVVRAMKAMAASSIGQYDESVRALDDYDRTIQLALSACLRIASATASIAQPKERFDSASVAAIVFGSDQGLVGRFNEAIAAHASQALASLPTGALIWAVGERVYAQLEDAGLKPAGVFGVPSSVHAITPLIGQLLLECDLGHGAGRVRQLYLYYNHRTSAEVCTPATRQLLPFDHVWQRDLVDIAWPGACVPEVLGGSRATLPALLSEYLFISLFRACAESLASENASRLEAMERADRNIEDLVTTLGGAFHRLRQSAIDEELFDVMAGFKLSVGMK